MNKQQRHKAEYLLHLLDDSDLKGVLLVLCGKDERRNIRRGYYLIGERRRNPIKLTPRLMIILTVCMAAVSIVSLAAAGVAPFAIYLVPLFFFYCTAIVFVRARFRLTRSP